MLTKKEFQDKILLKVQEEAKRTGRPEIDIMNEVSERIRQKMLKGSTPSIQPDISLDS